VNRKVKKYTSTILIPDFIIPNDAYTLSMIVCEVGGMYED